MTTVTERSRHFVVSAVVFDPTTRKAEVGWAGWLPIDTRMPHDVRPDVVVIVPAAWRYLTGTP